MPKYKVTMTVTLESHNDLPKDLGCRLNDIFHAWSDGRYPLAVELTHHGFRLCVREAIWHSFQKEMQERYGNEMIETGEKAWTSKWYLEALNKAKDSGDDFGFATDFNVTTEKL